MNIQELQTIVHHNLPIKIFLLNNNGYTSIRLTQDAYFPGGYVAADPSSGVTFPDIQKFVLLTASSLIRSKITTNY